MSLLEQLQNMSFEDREKIVFELKKKPEKKTEDCILEELKELSKKIDKIDKDNSAIYSILIVAIVLYFFMQCH